MPELPEVEVLVRHLRPLLLGRIIREVVVRHQKVLQPTTPSLFRRALRGAKFTSVERRGKYLRFGLRSAGSGAPFNLLGHLGMTGRMFLADKSSPLPKHAVVVLNFGRQKFIYEDARRFGRLTLDQSAVNRLGLEPLTKEFTTTVLIEKFKRSRQPVKVLLLNQAVVAGVGNIYASEALFRARISPRCPACRLSSGQVGRLCQSIRAVLSEAVRCGSTLPLNFARGTGGLFYFGRAEGAADFYEERLRVYGRTGKPCWRCGQPVKCITQASRSTFYCPACQKS